LKTIQNGIQLNKVEAIKIKPKKTNVPELLSELSSTLTMMVFSMEKPKLQDKITCKKNKTTQQCI
jgi:hypothetical protein